MKAKYSMLVCLATVFALTAIAGMALADTQSVTVPAGGSVPQNLGAMLKGDLLSIDWSSTTAVSAKLTGPSGYEKTYSASVFGVDVITLPHDGAYVLTLTNSGSTSATVTLTWNVSPFSGPSNWLDNIVTWFIIIAVIVIVIIIVVVVLVFVLGKKKKMAPMAGAPPGIVTPTTPGVCPVCGAQTDTDAPFCAKCGARFH